MSAPVRVTITGRSTAPAVTWPPGWPPPREGEQVELRELGVLFVRTVVWYPEGEFGEGDPFVYVVLGDFR